MNIEKLQALAPDVSPKILRVAALMLATCDAEAIAAAGATFREMAWEHTGIAGGLFLLANHFEDVARGGDPGVPAALPVVEAVRKAVANG